MEQAYDLYSDIAERTQGDLYIGVVGPMRAGKSTFIKRIMEKIVLPGIENMHIRERAQDELPQSGSGRTVMTTQPLFVPSEAAEVNLPGNHSARIRLIDSVGFLVDGALGTLDEDGQRMVQTPWCEEEISFEQAAEFGTKKIISQHATIGVILTTDGSVTELPRVAYIPAERQAIEALKSIQKPFVMVLNTSAPESAKTEMLRDNLEKEYGIPVIAVNAAQMEEKDIDHLLRKMLCQFPVRQISVITPEWIGALNEEHWLIESLAKGIQESMPESLKMGDAAKCESALCGNPSIEACFQKAVHLGSGCIQIQLVMKDGLFNQILAEQCGTEIKSDAHLLSLLCELVAAKKEYDHVANALDSVRNTGYGLVPPLVEEMTLQEPEIMKQGGRFGVKLRASAPSLHLIRVDIQTEVSPVVGTEEQSEEMIRYLMEGFEQDPKKLWQSNLFGKPLSDLVREGLANKLMHMPSDTQIKVQQTLEKIINDGTGGMICILL